MKEIFERTKLASRQLNQIDDALNKQVLFAFARALREQQEEILVANQKDLDASLRWHDRLLLNSARIENMASEVEAVANLPSPCGLILEENKRPNGLEVKRISTPLGVIGLIYEARPNVTSDAFALCFRASNACLLKGGSEAFHSNQAIIKIIHDVLSRFGLDRNLINLLPASREATHELLQARKYVDVLIPRGSQQLINYVRENSRIPTIETGAGVVHTYFDKEGDLQKAIAIIDNAKTRRVSVCNALDTLIIHQDRLTDLPAILKPLKQKGVEICEEYGHEFLALKMSVKIVSNLDEALEHIARYGSKHSEAIITENPQTADKFLNQVDAAAVYVNASTAFTDGGQLGLGAEIGISTQKLHARGPFALKALTTYKWIIHGNGHVRPAVT